ncbi:UNVERIFIED_CONTAM: hypothetical protein HDU68_000147, partial [Siphonaria sp. JEL0065]
MATALRRAQERNRAAISSSSSSSLTSSGANLEVSGSYRISNEERANEGPLARLRRRLGLTLPTLGEQELFRNEFVRVLNLRRQRDADQSDDNQPDDAEYWPARRVQLAARMNQNQNIPELHTRRSNSFNNRNQMPPPPPLPAAIANTSVSSSSSSTSTSTANAVTSSNLNLAFDGFERAIQRARSLRQQRHF